VKVVWATGECSIRQRSSICSRVDERVQYNVEDRDEIIDSISPIDR